MNYTEVELQQREILHRVHDSVEAETGTEANGILSTIRAYSEEEAQYAMGDFGVKLKKFSASIDLSHPDLKNLFSGQLVGLDEGTFSRDAHDLLKLASFGRSEGISQNVLENLKRVISKSEHYPTISRAIDSPASNQLFVRFVKDEAVRQSIRGSKQNQVVGLGTLYKKGMSFWEQHGSDFSLYYRHANRYQRDINEATDRMAHLIKCGLTSMAGEIQKSIDELVAKSEAETYHGFNRLSLVTASIILGKMHGYHFLCEYSPLSSCQTVMAYAKPDVFPNYQFNANTPSLDSPVYMNRIEYYPRLYNFEELKDEASEEMVKVVAKLDDYPELGHRPLFDHYRVLVPGLNYPNHFQSPPFHFLGPDGDQTSFASILDAQRALDRTLLRQRAVVGVLLGERDGDHYFVSYWK